MENEFFISKVKKGKKKKANKKKLHIKIKILKKFKREKDKISKNLLIKNKILGRTTVTFSPLHLSRSVARVISCQGS